MGIVADLLSSIRGMLTASHCSIDFFGTDNGPMFQPTTNRQVGTEYHDPSGWACGFLGINECRRSDASFYSVHAGVGTERGLIARTTYSASPGSGNGSLEVDQLRPYFLVGAVDSDDMLAGQHVQKVGAFSGWTRGQIVNTCVDYTSGGIPPNLRTVECLYESDMYVTDGDSGSPVFSFLGSGAEGGDLVKLVGIVKSRATFAGMFVSSFFSKWHRIVFDLGPLAVTREATLAQPSLSGAMPFLFPILSWPAVPGALRYHVFNGSNLVATTTDLSISFPQLNVLEYTGATQPTFQGIPFHVYAVSETEVSPMSIVVWFRAALGTFTVTISGPSVVGPNSFACSTWTAVVTGAAPSVSYTWSGFFTSQEPVVQGIIPASGAEFQVVVVDSQNRHGGAIKNVAYDPNNQDSCEQTGETR